LIEKRSDVLTCAVDMFTHLFAIGGSTVLGAIGLFWHHKLKTKRTLNVATIDRHQTSPNLLLFPLLSFLI
jgi:hypothetical protein